jgi:hypothetical protein
VKTRAFFANENEYISSKKKFVGVQPFIAANKQTKPTNKTKTTDAPRKTHSA